MFSICAWCLKACHSGDGKWRDVVKKDLVFVADETNAEKVSHGLCPSCFKREIADTKLAERREAWLELKNPKRSPITGEPVEGTGI